MSFLAHPLLAVRAACLWAPRSPALQAPGEPPLERIGPLELTDDLRRRVAAAAAGEGKSPHAFMLDAIEVQTRFAESRRDFVASVHAAEQRAMRYASGHDDSARSSPGNDSSPRLDVSPIAVPAPQAARTG